jgi:hypothetical protein
MNRSAFRTQAVPLLLCALTFGALGAPGPAADVRWRPAVTSRAEFDGLARVTETPYRLPHVLFVIDRKSENRIYYINSRKYTFHRDFVNSEYLSLERGPAFFENNYLQPNRRFIMGTIAYQTPLQRWTFEFWEGDLIPRDQILLTSRVISKTFFAPVAFKPNSLRQEEASVSLPGVSRVLQRDLVTAQDYQPLNLARGIGRIRVIEKLDEHVTLGPDEIPVLAEVPVSLPPVAGIITARPSTPLSHINLLAGSWGVPSASIRDAQVRLRPYDGAWVSFETKRTTYSIQRVGPDQLQQYQRRVAARRRVMTPRADLSVKRLAELRRQRAASVVAYGAKSANLGEVAHARLPGLAVPSGFTIPFFYYDQFIRENHLAEPIREMRRDPRFARDAAYRRERLAALRERMTHGRLNRALRAHLLRRVHAAYAGKGLFVRSSTNAEDLPNFNGAGLYTTVPNVRGDEPLVEAVKTVWASIWNFEAYEARERAGVEHTNVYMAVLVQEGISAESAGVMITTDPFDPENRDSVYISAKRGLGIKVVEGKKVPEQVIFRRRANAIQVLTRSAEDNLLAFDEHGGVKELPITGDRTVLTDDVVRRLARAAGRIKQVFGGREQDIEWAYQGGRIYIVQSRPYLAGR